MRQHGRARSLVGSAFGNYLPQQLISATEVGSLFVARTPEQGSACLLRVLSLPPGAPEAEMEEHAARFLHAASQLQQIQHPYLLPLTDAGVVGEVPFLVWPLIAMRPLATIDGRVAPADALTAGRYLDEIAAALEHARGRGLIHGNLALEGIYAQRDGRLLVGDLGVRQLIELLRHDMQWHYLYTLTDPSAPEQTLGRRVQSATDVYLLACVLFRLLTGRQIYGGASREDVAHAHLHEPVPPLSVFRPDLPRALDGLLAAALAKEPGSRIQRPGELANAYHEIVAPGNTARVPFATAGPDFPQVGTPNRSPMSRPLTYGPFSPLVGGAGHSNGNGSRATRTPRPTGPPYDAGHNGATPNGSTSGGGWSNGAHPELPQPSPRLTRPPVLSGPAAPSRPLTTGGPPPSRPLTSGSPLPTSRPLSTGGPADPSRPRSTGRPMVPSQPMSQPRPPSQTMTYVRQPPTSQPMVPPRNMTAPPLPTGTGPVPPMRITAAPAGARGPIEPPRRSRRLLVIPLLIVLVAVGGGLALRASTGAAPAGGQVIFSDNPAGPAGTTSVLTILATAMPAPAQGSHYAAWLVNSKTEQVVPLGSLTPAQGNRTYSLSFLGATTGSPNLLAAGDTAEITVETGVVSAPAGRVVLAGSFPVHAFVHIGHLLIAYSTTPGGIGIMTGALRQVALVDTQARALLEASGAGDQVSVRCRAQNVVNIIEGRKGSDYQALSSVCLAAGVAPSGDGYGLFTAGAQAEPGYLDAAVLHASLAATQSDATPALQQHAQGVEVAIDNARSWLREALSDALALRVSPANQTQAKQLQTLADEAYQGTDTNGDGRVDPVQGEAGIATAYIETQRMATITLAPR